MPGVLRDEDRVHSVKALPAAEFRFRSPAAAILRRNVFVYETGGIIAPFIFIKLIDLLLTATGVS